MNSQDDLLKWSQSEGAAHSCIELAADWSAKFFDERSKFFHVALTDDDEWPKPPTPNTASYIVAAAIGRNEQWLTGLSQHTNVDKLQDRAAQMREAVKTAAASNLLPLRSFGVLPLFSTAFLANYLPIAFDDDGALGGNIAYAVAMRRLLGALHSKDQASELRRRPHAYLIYHVSRALRTLKDRVERTPGAFTQIADPDGLWGHVSETLAAEDRTRIEGDFRRLLRTDDGPFEGGLLRTIEDCLSVADELALQAALTEIAAAARETAVNDPTSLAFALLTMAEAKQLRHANTVAQGVEHLVNMCSGGLFWPGRPFYSDSRGISLLVTSVETASALIATTLNPRIPLSDEVTSRVLAVTAQMQQRLDSEHNEVRVRQEDSVRGIEGWCSDRASSTDRIESWVTGHALEFFIWRMQLLRFAKKRSVFSEFSTLRATEVKPNWASIQDPDDGHCTQTLMGKIDAALDNQDDAIAPVFLLYGPPGTSKTTIAKAAATHGERNWDIVLLSPSDFVKDGLEKVEYRSRIVFDQLMKLNHCVVIFDEIDTLFRSRRLLRSQAGASMLEFVVPALLPKLQDIRDYSLSNKLMLFFLTNYVEMIDDAIVRSGRIDNKIVVLPYSRESRWKLAEGFFRKVAPQDLDDQLEQLKSFLDRAPCNLVYRDIQRLASSAARPGTTEQMLDAQAKRMGVRPATYDPEQREGAGEEFAYFYGRLTGQDYPAGGFDRPAQLRDFITSCRVKTRDNPLFEEWSAQALIWEGEVMKPQTGR